MTVLFQNSYLHFLTSAIPWKKKLIEQPNNGTTIILLVLWFIKHFTKSRMQAPKSYMHMSTQLLTCLISKWATEFYLFLFIIDDMVVHKTRTSLKDLEEFFLELMVLIISYFHEGQILKYNLTKYFDDEINHKLIKDFVKKVHAWAMQHSKTSMLHLILIL